MPLWAGWPPDRMKRTTDPALGKASALLAARQRRWRLGLALLGLLVLALTAWNANRQRQTIEREALARNTVYARVLEGHASRIVGTTANTLATLADNPLVSAQVLDADAVRRLMTQQLPGQPYLRSISLLDHSGRVLVGTTATDTGLTIDLERLGPPPVDARRVRMGPVLAVRDLGELAANASPAKGAAAMPMLRRVQVDAGAPRWLVVLVNVDYLNTQHELITRDQPIRALLLGLDGRLISSTGDDALAPGADLTALPPVQRVIAHEEQGSYLGPGSDGRRVLAAFRSARQWPLLVLAESPYEDVQAAWKAEMAADAGVAAVLLALLAGLGWLAERGTRRELQALTRLDTLHQEVARMEERWTLALDGAGHGVWDMDLATGLTDVSARLMGLLGQADRADVWTVDRWRDNVHPDDLAPAIEAARQHLRGETPSLEIELRMRSAGGRWKWLLARGTRSGQPDAARRGMRLVGTLTDISKRKAAEAALRESDARQQAILHSALDAIVTIDAEGRVIDFNPAAEQMFGHSAERASGQPMHELIVPHKHRQAHLTGVARYQATGVARVLNRRIEIEALRADGTLFPVELTIVPVRTDEGEFFTATLRDITERRRVEQALRASEALLDKTGRIGGIGGWQLDVATGFIDSTEQTCRIHDMPVCSRGTLAQMLGFYAPEARADIGAAFDLALATGQGFDLELPLDTAQGRRIWVRVVATAEIEAGQVVRLAGALQDITLRRQAEAELRDARQRELMIGARIQQSLLVDAPNQRLPGLWLSTLNQASQGIDGDFVELISLGERGLDIIVGDVMGKGVSAALMAAGTKMQFNRSVVALMAEPERNGELPSPAEVVAAVHLAMTPNLQALEAFVTLSYLRLDMLAGTITWVGCGHEEPLLLCQSGGLLSLANQHPPMGVLDTLELLQDTVPFGEGDALFLCSDGAADALMPDGSRLGRDRVTALLVALLDRLQTPAAVLHALRRELTRTGARITDDLTLALAIASGPTELASRRELPAELVDLKHVRGLIEHRCLQAGLGEVETSLFAVACVEAYTNAVRHTHGRPEGAPVEVVVRILPDALIVDIVTLGDPFVLPPPVADTSFDDFPEGGFGLTIMQQATDSVEHRHDLGVNTVRLIRLRRAGGS
jgi:PAS domain S-box-containing protein